jgi:hypothetical protein
METQRFIAVPQEPAAIFYPQPARFFPISEETGFCAGMMAAGLSPIRLTFLTLGCNCKYVTECDCCYFTYYKSSDSVYLKFVRYTLKFRVTAMFVIASL